VHLADDSFHLFGLPRLNWEAFGKGQDSFFSSDSNILFQYPEYPLAIYQVSGEYAMIWHGAKAGAFDLDSILLETLTSMRRAGVCVLCIMIFKIVYS